MPKKIVFMGTPLFAVPILKSLYQKKEWLLFALSFNLIFICFFPLIGGMSLFNNWIGAAIWMLIGWVLVTSKNYKTL